MNYKKRFFYLYSSIVAFFVVSSTLFFNHYLSILFDRYLYVGIFVTIIAILINLFLIKHLFNAMTKGEENLDKKIKHTLHELNIPASTIQINTQMLQKALSNDEKSLKRLARIDEATKQLIKLYDKMEYEIKKEIDKIEKQEFDIKELVYISIAKFEEIKGDIKIKSDVSNTLFYGDKDGFEIVLDNLISNSIKYNKKDGIVEISYKNGFLKIFNSGEKIDTKNIFLLFEQYYQQDSSIKGFGLGLNIIKEYCDKNGIEIKIESNSVGTTFVLNLEKIIKV